jgi:hypothetical protein
VLPEAGRWAAKHKAQKEMLLRMEFRKFLNNLLLVPCQIIKTGRRIVYRLLQPWKIRRSSLHDAVEGRVLIYVHKEQQLDDVARRYPARQYVLVDDKLRILTAAKNVWGSRLTTVRPRQGHYARDPQALATYPSADITVEGIGDVLRYDLAALLAAGQPAGTRHEAETSTGE